MRKLRGWRFKVDNIKIYKNDVIVMQVTYYYVIHGFHEEIKRNYSMPLR